MQRVVVQYSDDVHFMPQKISIIFTEVKENSMKENFGEPAVEIIACKKMETIPLTDKENDSYANQTNCHIYKK